MARAARPCPPGLGRMSAYDAAAPSFERHRALPDGVPQAIRSAVLAATGTNSRPRLLDLGAGTGRIGWPFVAARDDYVGVDLSFGMLRAFLERPDLDVRSPHLVQTDGQLLPFRDATFDAVMLMQIFGGMRNWRPLMAEVRRVLRPAATLVIGRSVAPEDGIDARMKQRLTSQLAEMGIEAERRNVRDDVQQWLEALAPGGRRIVVATWSAERTPRAFLERHQTGAWFSLLPEAVKEEALGQLGAWAAATLGPLDRPLVESHRFELTLVKFPHRVEC